MSLSCISSISSTAFKKASKNPLQLTIQKVDISGTAESWNSSAMSADGTKMYAGSGKWFYKFENNQWTKVDIQSPSTGTYQNLQVERLWRFMDCNADATKIIACLGGTFMYMSQDGGLNWTILQPEVTNQRRDWITISCDSTCTKIIAGATFQNCFITTNGGSSWTKLTQNASTILSMSKNGNNIVSMGSGNGYTSNDNCATWSTITTVTGTGQTTMIDNNNNSYYGYRNVINFLKNINGSTTATNTITATLSTTSWSACRCNSDGTKAIVVTESNQGGVYISTDSGSTWTNYQSQINAVCGYTAIGWKTCSISEDGKKFIIGSAATTGNSVGLIIVGTFD